jgi:hypothetical protein
MEEAESGKCSRKPMSGPGRKLPKEEFMARAGELITSIRTAMLTTRYACTAVPALHRLCACVEPFWLTIGASVACRHGDDLYSRPMVIQDREFDGTLYFLTSSKTGKCSDLVDHPKVNLAFAKPSTNRCGLRVVQTERKCVLDSGLACASRLSHWALSSLTH